MLSAPSRASLLWQTVVIGALTCTGAPAQIHEEKPTPGLEEGLVFHAPDPAAKNPNPKIADIGITDFSLCFWIPANAPADPQFLAPCRASKASGEAGWSVSTGDAVTVRLMSPSLKEPVTMSTPSTGLGEGLHQIAVVIRRDARQPLSGIWIDGVERVSVAVPPVSLSCPDSPLTLGEGDGVHGFHDLRIYNRALTRVEILDLMWHPSAIQAKPKHPAPPPNGPRFIPQPDETIALIGGTEAVALAESGELEALLLMAFPQTRFHFRSLAWEGDTVFRQDRPMNFGSLEQQLRRVNAGAVFVMFGRQECLEAVREAEQTGKLRKQSDTLRDYVPVPSAKFTAALEKLLGMIRKLTPNIVVFAPWYFAEQPPPPFPDFTVVNDSLRSWQVDVQRLCERCSITFAPVHAGSGGERQTSDGLTLTASGRHFTAWCVAEGLKPYGVPFGNDRDTGKLLDNYKRLRDLVAAKSRLWHDYWRPSNWAFLHGDRTNQPSSRDPVNPQIRFFPAEQEKYLPLIKDAEEKIFKLVEEAQKKLP